MDDASAEFNLITPYHIKCPSEHRSVPHDWIPSSMAFIIIVLAIVTAFIFLLTQTCHAGSAEDHAEIRGIDDSRHIDGYFNSSWEALAGPVYRDDIDLVVDPKTGYIYTYGGRTRGPTDINGVRGDLVFYDNAIEEWRPATNGDKGPGLISGANLAIDADGRRIFLLGGEGLTTPNTDLWEYNITTAVWTNIGTNLNAPCHEIGYHDDHVYGLHLWPRSGYPLLLDFDLASHNCLVYEVPDIAPTTRQGFATTFDQANGRFFVFGGETSADYTNALASLDVHDQSVRDLQSLPAYGRRCMDITYDPVHDLIYLGGGTGSTSELDMYAEDDLWCYDAGTDRWSLVKDPVPFGPQTVTTLAYDPGQDRVHIYCSVEGPYELWRYDVPARSWRSEPDRAWPERVMGPTLMAYKDHVMLFGGADELIPPAHDGTYVLDAGAGTCTLDTATPKPSARHWQATAIDQANGRLFVYGGLRDASTPVYDLWCYDWETSRWTQLQSFGDPMLVSASLAYSEVDSSLYLVGGEVQGTAFNYDLWRYDFTDHKWYMVPTVGSPTWRMSSTLTYLSAQGKLCLFGGSSSSGDVNDMWLYDPKDRSWTSVPWEEIWPWPRHDHAVAYDAYSNHLLIYGGTSDAHGYLQDMWIYDFTERHMYSADGTSSPGPRKAPALALDQWNGVIYLYGGDKWDRTLWRRSLDIIHANLTPELTSVSTPEDSLFEQSFKGKGRPGLEWTMSTDAEWLLWNSTSTTVYGTPDNTDVGEYWVFVGITDTEGLRDEVNFTLVVVNTVPVIITAEVNTVTEGQDYYVDYDSSDDGQGDVTWHMASDAGPWLSFDVATGVLSGTPDDPEVGMWQVDVSVEDGNGGSAHDAFRLVVLNVNDPPTIITTPATTIHRDEGYQVTFAATDPDPTKDVMAWSLETDSGFLAMDPSTGLLHGIPTSDDVGGHMIRVTVMDGNGGSDSIEYRLEVIDVNDPPVIGARPPDLDIDEDTAGMMPGLASWFTDPNEDTLRFWWEGNDSIAVFLLSNGSVLFEPSHDWSGARTITFHANDSSLEVNDSIVVTVRPVNDPPEGPSITLLGQPFRAGGPQIARGNATDPDLPYGEGLEFTWSSNVTGRIGRGRELNLSLPAGRHLVTLMVNDLSGALVETSVVVEVLEAGPPDGTDGEPSGGTDGDGSHGAGPPLLLLLLVVIIICALAVASVILAKHRSKGGRGTAPPPPEDGPVEDGGPPAADGGPSARE